MRLRPFALRPGVALVLAWATAGCMTEVVTHYPCGDVCPDDAGNDATDDSADVAVDAPVADGSGDTGGDDTGGEAQWVGLPCETPADCTPGTACVTEQFLGTFGLQGVEVPNGMCSSLFCTDDASCGPRGLCFDATGLTGGTPVRICLQTCDGLPDCRWEEGYTCQRLDELVEDATGGVCVSDSIAVALLSDGEE